MPIAAKYLDPNTGAVIAKDCLTGTDLTPAQILAGVKCPTTASETSEVCYQLQGNTEFALIEKNGKEVCTFETTYLSDGSVDTVTLVRTLLLDAAGVDITATHEKTACPAPLIYAGEFCYPA